MKEKKNKNQSIENEEFIEDELTEEPKGKKVKADKIKEPVEKKPKKPKNRSKYTSKYFKKFSGRAEDSYEDMLHEDYKHVINRAHQLSSIKESDYESLIVITVPDAFDHKGKVSYRLDKKPDGTYTLLYDQALVTVLFFGLDSLFYHQANVDHRNGHIAFDVAGEFNYFDVVHMETSIKYDNNDHPKYIMLDLEIGLADGTIVPFHLRNHHIHSEYELNTLLTETESKILEILKSKVRTSRKL
ncbi:MAG: hypothetical protein CVV57_08335 [Tenericutes bacterium HGW-Tenericutes-2]|jgi:hypothetical protein|nr:MAG: hypothetical protein CVV57_08335 [Tenericutes bacterium HGW-Tenericutes-2]